MVHQVGFHCTNLFWCCQS